VRVFKVFQLDLPEGSYIYADTAYHDSKREDLLMEAGHMQLCPIRKKNSTRAIPPSMASGQQDYRKMSETGGSLMERRLPKTIHAVTATGFALKVFLFVLASRINGL
jgi:hypothetical protein